MKACQAISDSNLGVFITPWLAPQLVHHVAYHKPEFSRHQLPLVTMWKDWYPDPGGLDHKYFLSQELDNHSGIRSLEEITFPKVAGPKLDDGYAQTTPSWCKLTLKFPHTYGSSMHACPPPLNSTMTCAKWGVGGFPLKGSISGTTGAT